MAFYKLKPAIILIIALGLGVFYYYWGWSHLAGYRTDDALYLLLADYFSPYYNDNLLVAEYAFSHRIHPPLYPLILALFGAGSDHILNAHLVTISFLLLSLIVFYFWLKRENFSASIAIITVILFALLPYTLLLNTEIWSENTYIFLSLLALYWASKDHNSTKEWFFIALLVGLSTITRTIGISLLAAFIIYIWLKPKSVSISTQCRLYLTLFSSLPFLCIALFNQWYPTSSKGYLGNWLYYVSNNISENAFGFIWQFLITQSNAIAQAWGKLFSDTAPDYLFWVLILIFLLSMVGWVMRLKNLKLDAIYSFLYMSIVFIWPYQDHIARFIYALLPIILFYGLFALKNFQVKSFLSRLFPIIYLLIISIAVFPSSYFYIHSLGIDVPAEVAAYKRMQFYLGVKHRNANIDAGILSNGKLQILYFEKQMYTAFKNITSVVPEDQCIYSTTPELIMLIAKRMSYNVPLSHVDQATFLNKTSECQYFFLATPTLYPLDRLQDIQILQTTYLYDDNKSEGIVALLVKYQ